jgi:erythrin-vacuolar iron transport family protein
VLGIGGINWDRIHPVLETALGNSKLVGMARNFKDLSEREILALAISLEEEDGRVYADFADGLRETYPATAKLFDDMGAEESGHRASLIATYRERFGEHIPLVRRQDVKGFVQRRPMWLARPLKIAEVRKQAEIMELETRQFYQKAITQVTDAGIRKLLGDLEEVERKHQVAAEAMSESIPQTVKKTEDEAQRRSVCVADRAARPGRLDGWIGIHAGSRVCRGLRHEK